MFSIELARKAIFESTWRNHTVLGRKVARSITVGELNSTNYERNYKHHEQEM